MDAWARLDLFVEKAEYLLTASLWDRVSKIEYTISFKAGEVTESLQDQPTRSWRLSCSPEAVPP
jgi:hypothetical protein